MAEEIIKVKVDLDVAEFSKNAKAMSDAISKVLGKEVEIFNGRINKTAKLVENTEKALGGAAIAANKAGNSIKQSNQQWTNFALVIQDLPYGFRGIQNNLPAIIGGFAGLSGPIYLAASAIIALFTAWDAGLIKFGKSIKLNTDFSKEAATAYSSQSTELQSLYRVATDANKPMNERIEASKALKAEYPGLLKGYSDEDIALGKAKTAYENINKVLWQYAQAKAASKALDELAVKQLEIDTKRDKAKTDQQGREIKAYKEIKSLTLDQMSFSQRLVKTFNDLPTAMIQFPMLLGAMKKSEDILGGIEEDQKSLNIEKQKYLDIIDSNINAEKKLKDFTNDDDNKKIKIEDNSIELLKSRQQYYKDNILMFASFEQEILKREEKLAVKQAQSEGKSALHIKNIRAKFSQDRINSAKDVSDKLDEIQSKLGEEEGKELQKRIDDAEKVSRELKVIDDRNLQNSLDALKLESEVRTKLLNRTNKSDTEGRIKILEDYKNKLYDLASIGGYTEDQLDKINDAIVRIDAAIEGSKPVLKTYASNWTDTTNQIFDVVNNLVEGLITQLGQNLGKALAGENIDVLGGFGEQIGGALEEIGKALIAYGVAIKAFQLAQANPYAAIAAGFALVVAGAALKSKFGKAQAALGGGSSNVNSNTTSGAFGARPSFGLLGQSPNSTTGSNMSSIDNAQNMSNNSATFVLKGQDLLLSVNRAQKASQLKGQNINLAG
jgi:hypothetical protein